MQVNVQKLTSTTWPRSWAGPSGSELSHSVAPPSDGMCGLLSMVGYRRDRKPARSSSEKSCGSCQAAKWLPLSNALK